MSGWRRTLSSTFAEGLWPSMASAFPGAISMSAFVYSPSSSTITISSVFSFCDGFPSSPGYWSLEENRRQDALGTVQKHTQGTLEPLRADDAFKCKYHLDIKSKYLATLRTPRARTGALGLFNFMCTLRFLRSQHFANHPRTHENYGPQKA